MANTVQAFTPTVATDPTQTSKGTKIVQSGSNDLDQNAFLQILTSELANQDPTSTQDGTEYISQMAQFSALEQMTDLNSSIKLNNASSLIGKTVAVKEIDSSGNPYTGVVKSATKDGDTINVNVVVGKTTDSSGNTVDNTMPFSIDDITNVES